MYSLLKYSIIIVSIIPLICNADVVRCKFGFSNESLKEYSIDFTIVLPSEEDKKYVGYFDSEYPNIDTLEILGHYEIGKVIDDSIENTAIIVNNRAGWREVIWLPYKNYSRKITWDPSGLRKETPEYDYENTTKEERLKQLEAMTAKNKGYAEYTFGRVKYEGICK